MVPNSLAVERAAVVAVIDPDAYGTGAQNTSYFPLKDFRRFMAIVMAGDFVSTGKIDAKFTVYTDNQGGGALDVPGAAITQLTEAGTDSNKQAIIEFNTDLIAGNTAYTHGRLTMTLTTAGADSAAVVLGFDPVHGPASDSDLAAVDEIVHV